MNGANAVVDLLVGVAVAFALLSMLTKMRSNPFDLAEMDEYQTQYGEGPITVTPEAPSAWIEWDNSERMPRALRIHTRVQVRYANGQTSEVRYASCFYWGRYDRYPAHGSHIAAYRIVND